MTCSTSCARAAAKSAVSAHGEISPPRASSSSRMRSPSSVPPGSRVETTLRPSPRSASASNSACVDLPLPSIPSKVTNTFRRICVPCGERTRSVESSYAPTLDAAHWRTATIIACAIAVLELALLVGIGVTVLGKSVAHRVQDAAIAKVAGVSAIPKETSPGKPKLARGQTNVLVLNGSGAAGAAGTAAGTPRARRARADRHAARRHAPQRPARRAGRARRRPLAMSRDLVPGEVLSGHGDGDTVDGVVAVAADVPLALERLLVSRLVPRAEAELMAARSRVPHESPPHPRPR